MITAKDLFAGDKTTHDTFFCVWDKVRSIFPDSDLEVYGEVVMVKEGGHPYLFIWAPARGNGRYGDCPVVVSFGLDSKVPVSKNMRRVQVEPDRWVYHCGVGEDGVVCNTLISLIGRAHEDKVGSQ